MHVRSAIVVTAGFILGSVLTPALFGQAANPMQGTLAHIAFVVHDVDKTAAAFGNVFGVPAPPAVVARNVAFPPSYGGATMNAKYTLVSANGVEFEFVEPLDGQSPWKDFLEKHGEGVQNIAFNVPNAAEARMFLESKGGKWTQAIRPTMAYVDMAPKLPITFEVIGPRPAPPAK